MTSSLSAWWMGQGAGWGPVLARVAGLVWTAPAVGAPALGWRLRLALAAALAAVLAPVVGPGLPPAADGSGVAVQVGRLAAEALVGAGLGLAAGLVLAGARQAGELVGAQAGLAPAALLDPEAGGELTPLGHLYGLIALATFLALDGPLGLVGALAESYRVVPPGGPPLEPALAGWAFARVGRALELAVRAAAPAALALALAGLVLGLLARAAPALPLGALALPLRAALGVLLVLVGLATLSAAFAAAWGDLGMGMG